MLDRKNSIAPVAYQTQYQAIFDNSLDAIVITDIAGIIQSANPAVTRVFGFDPAETVGRSIAMLVPEAAGRAVADRATGVRKDGGRIALEVARTEWQRDGALFFCSLMREAGAPDTAVAEARSADLHTVPGAGLAEIDGTGRFVSVDERYCEILGRERAELLALRLVDITHPDDRERVPFLVARLAAGDGPLLLEERYVRGDGAIVWVTKTASPVRLDGDEPVARVVAIDVTERKAAEETLHESEERLRVLHNELTHLARVNDLGEMAVAIAHEIYQPLTAIANYLDAGRMVVAHEPTVVTLAAARRAMELADEQALRAGRIVNSLREFARKGQGTRRIVAADSLVDAAMAMALIDAREKGISLTHKAAGGDALVAADPVQIEQVLMNLVRNAIDALDTNPPGAPRDLDIVTRSDPEAGLVEFRVSDSGPGIAPDIRPRLFQTFVTTKPAGTGMGLSVCRRIVEAHGGTIEADSAGGTGATFRLSLPLHRMNEERIVRIQAP